MDKRFRILAVDDEPINIQLMTAALKDEYDMLTALNGHDAISQLKEHKPDLILLDVMMPDITGFEFCKIIQADERFANIPIIFLTALDTQNGELQGLELGSIDYLTKPINFTQLKLRVRNCIALKEQRDLLVHQKAELEQSKKDLHDQTTALEEEIMAKQRMHDELQLLNQRYSFAVDSAKIGVWDYYIPENKLVWDKRMFALYGVEEKQSSRAFSVWRKGVHPDDMERGNVAIAQALRGEKDFGGEFRVIWPNGEIRHLKVSAMVLRDADGKPLRMIGVNYDITEQKRVEADLQEERQRLVGVIEATKAGTWEWNIQTKEIAFNSYAAEIIGCPLEEISPGTIGSWMKRVHPDDVVASKELMKKHLSGELPYYEMEMRVKHKDGTWVWIINKGKVTRWTDDDNPLLMQGTHQDITAYKQVLEDLAAARDKAEAATQAKSSFLATMSHEIRTPMNGVIGMSNLLLETDLSEEQRQYAEIVNKSGENLLGLLNDILDFSKIEAGKLDMEILDFDIRITLEDTAEMLAIRASQAGLELICHIDPAVPEYLKGDPGRLRQIITNLAGNSIKFTHQGEIGISAALASEDNDFVVIRFEIADTGIGIPENRRAALFTPFTQVDGSTTRKYGGTGLGLAICKQLTELMGGEIGIESEEGKGSTFWFTARFEKQSEVSIAPEVLADITGTKILVVDDNAANRMLLTTLLNHWGCRHDTAVDGVDGLALLQKAVEVGDPFRIALLDQEMPGMDGSELGRLIKADPLLQSTLLFMVTSLAQRGDAAAMEKIGFAGYLPKPVRQKQLHECIAIVLGRGDKTSRGIVTQHTSAEVASRTVTSPHDTRILMAEDNIINQKVAQSILGKLGYKADVVANGLEAVRALEMINYDIVLMDCQMPEMNGYEATAMIRDPESKVLNHTVPIIAMTANAMKGEREACIEAGMDDYMSKPVKKDELAAMLEKWG